MSQICVPTVSPTEFEALERLVFEAITANCEKHSGEADVEAVFVLGAPRTGSTLMYQAICSRFGLPYIANITNDRFPSTPIIGIALQKAFPVHIAFDSRFGKTKGPFQPSEGSALMMHWFGKGDPPGLKSATFRAGLEQHFIDTIWAAAALFAAPLVIKNAWNCFRVPCLARTLPEARFIWIRRDIADAAKSDLDARYKTKGDPTAWNSATPTNINELRRMPVAAQLIENQHAFNNVIRDNLKSFATGRSLEIWYEDLQHDPDRVLARVGAALGRRARPDAPKIDLLQGGSWKIERADGQAIDAYLAQHRDRLASDRHPRLS